MGATTGGTSPNPTDVAATTLTCLSLSYTAILPRSVSAMIAGVTPDLLHGFLPY